MALAQNGVGREFHSYLSYRGPEVAWRFVRWPPEEPANELRFTNRVQDGGHSPPGRNPDRQDEQPKAEHENRGKPLGHGGRQDK